MDFLRPKRPRDGENLGDPGDPRRLRRNPLVWIAVIGAIVLYSQYDGSLLGNLEDARRQTIRLADVGGPFELVDHTGRAVTEQDFRGRYMLVYFGYTWGPDVCPANLLVMGQALEMLGKAGEKVQPLFITVDPARDTVESLAKFVGKYHPRLLALTGGEAQIAAAAKAYKVFYKKGKKGEAADDYLIEHSDFIYLMGPDGAFLDYFQRGQRPAEIARLIGRYL